MKKWTKIEKIVKFLTISYISVCSNRNEPTCWADGAVSLSLQALFRPIRSSWALNSNTAYTVMSWQKKTDLPLRVMVLNTKEETASVRNGSETHQEGTHRSPVPLRLCVCQVGRRGAFYFSGPAASLSYSWPELLCLYMPRFHYSSYIKSGLTLLCAARKDTAAAGTSLHRGNKCLQRRKEVKYPTDTTPQANWSNHTFRLSIKGEEWEQPELIHVGWRWLSG